MKTADHPRTACVEVDAASIHVGTNCLAAACELDHLDAGLTRFCMHRLTTSKPLLTRHKDQI